MDNGKVTTASFCPDVLVSIFKFLDTQSKGKAAQVCTSWKKAADYRAIWKNATVRLSGNISVQSEKNIIKRGIKRFDVLVFKSFMNEFLLRVPDVEHLRFIGCCMKQNLNNFFSALPNSDEIIRLAIETNYQRPDRDDTFSLIKEGFAMYHQFNRSSCLPNTTDVLKAFTIGMKQLKVLHLEGCLHFGDYTSLFDEEVTVSKNQLPSLEKLCLKHFSLVTEETIDYISQMFVNLVSLTIEGCEIESDKGFVNLAKLEKLEYLSFLYCDDITQTALNSISNLLNLKFLDLGWCEKITDSGLEFISRLKNLVSFKADCLSVPDTGFRHLNQMPLLRKLALHTSTISDMGLLYLAGGTLKLTKLEISSCENVTDQGLVNICQSTFVLHYLDVRNCTVTDYGIRSIIEKFSYLQVLRVDSCDSITNRTRQSISAHLHRNKDLNSDCTRQDDNCIILSTDPVASRLESFLDQVIQ